MDFRTRKSRKLSDKRMQKIRNFAYEQTSLDVAAYQVRQEFIT